MYKNSGFDFSVQTERFCEPIVEACADPIINDEDKDRIQLSTEETEFLNSGFIDKYSKMTGINEPVERLIIVNNPKKPEGIENKDSKCIYDSNGEIIYLRAYIDGNTGEFLQSEKLDAVANKFDLKIDRDYEENSEYYLDLLQDIYNVQGWIFRTICEQLNEYLN